MSYSSTDVINSGTIATVLSGMSFEYDTPSFLSSPFYITYDLTKRNINGTEHEITNQTLKTFYARTLDTVYSQRVTDSSWTGGNLDSYQAPYIDPDHYVLEVFETDQSTIKFMGNDVSETHKWRLTYCTTAGDSSTAYTTILYGSHNGATLTIQDGLQYPVSGLTSSSITGSAVLEYLYYLQDNVSTLASLGAASTYTTFLTNMATANASEQTTLIAAQTSTIQQADSNVTTSDVQNAYTAFLTMAQTITTQDPTISSGQTYTNERFGQTPSETTYDVTIGSSGGGGGGGGGGATGDPYITTFSGKTYKMDDFTGFVRMLQGTIDNKLFTINAETNLLTKEEITDLIIMRNKTKKTSVLEPHLCNDKFPAYFTKLYVQWGDDNMIIDLKQHNIISDTRNQDYELVVSDVQEYNWSNKTSKAIKMMIPFGEVTLVVKKFDNLDVRNGFTVLNHEKIENRSGALEHTIYTKDIKLKKLNTLTPLKRLIDRAPKRFSKETFNETKNFSRIVELPIF